MLGTSTWFGVAAGAADCGGGDGEETSLHPHPLLPLLHLLLLRHHLALLRAPFTSQRLSEALRTTLSTRVVEKGGGGGGRGVPEHCIGQGAGDGGRKRGQLRLRDGECLRQNHEDLSGTYSMLPLYDLWARKVRTPERSYRCLPNQRRLKGARSIIQQLKGDSIL